MEKIIMLGTGCGSTIDYYNTCFVIQNDNGNLLVDTGGSIELIKRLKKANLEIKDIENIFISHSHTDHVLGMIWLLKKLFGLYLNNKLKNHINVYCNDEVYKSIKGIAEFVLPKKLLDVVYDFINFHILKDNETVEINGINYTFFDIKAKGFKQYGFKCMLNNKKFFFLGDETVTAELYDVIKNADYVMHEAFCLDAEQDIFHPYEKHHSTVKSVCEVMEKLNIKNLILYHTEETHKKEKTKLYNEEGNKYFKGNLIVPLDLDEINIK